MMRADVPQSARAHARAMRRSLTDAQRTLWHALRDRRMQSVKFHRQTPIGPYLADFLCIEHRLVIEADGSRHGQSLRDVVRDEWLARNGYKILRFWNNDILTARESVLATIAATCGPPS